MTKPLMPKSTAIWLLENTALTFAQIAAFCGMHPLEVETLANDESTAIAVGLDPIAAGQLDKEELDKAIADSNYHMKMRPSAAATARKTSKYTPISRRQDKPNAIAWLLKHRPEMSVNQIVKLIGTTKKTIEAIRDKSHWNMQNIKAQSPVLLELCTQEELDRLS